MNNKEFKKILDDYIREEADFTDDYVTHATGALKRSGYGQYFLFHHHYGPDKRQLVLLNSSASREKLESGIIWTHDGKIAKFKDSDDIASITVNSIARSLIMEAIDAENDIIRLRELSKYKVCWIIHSAPVEDGRETVGVPIKNYHTHGIAAAYQHKDFQLVLDVGRQQAALILNCLADRVRNGEVFSDGELVTGVYEKCALKLVTVTEGNRKVFRVLVPDENNIYPGEPGCAFPYSAQALEV